MNTPHPELEELAALVETDSSTAADTTDIPSDVRSHVEACGQCAADLAALRDVRATLRSLPPVTMPDDVAQRLESAVRAAAASTERPAAAAISVLPAGGSGRGGGRGDGRRDRSVRGGGRRGSASGLPNLSVAAAVTVFVLIGVGVALGVGLSHGGGSNKGASTAAGASAGSVVVASGNDYTQADIRNQVAGLVLAQVPDAPAQYKGLAGLAATSASSGGGSAPAARPSAASAPTAETASAAPMPTSTASSTAGALANGLALAPRTPFSGPLGDTAQLQACVQALLDQAATPVLVDYAYYAGKPATIIVLKDPADPSTLDVYVEADTADCAKAGDVTFVAFLRNAS